MQMNMVFEIHNQICVTIVLKTIKQINTFANIRLNSIFKTNYLIDEDIANKDIFK